MPVRPIIFLDYAISCINRGADDRPPVTERCFKAHFKLSPQGCSDLYNRLTDAVEGTALSYMYDVPFEDTEPRHLLWLLYYFFTYSSEDVAAALFGVTPKTYRKYVWTMAVFLKDMSFKLVSKKPTFCFSINF